MAQNYLERAGFQFISPEPASREDLLRVHTEAHVQKVEQGDFHDPDCPRYPDIHMYAALSAGGAIAAQERCGFSIMRPPGHHAGPDFLGGFCYYNALAVAVRRSELNTLIVDIDGHHGNGTEAIFSGEPGTAYVSLHRMYNYPGTGQESRGNCLNFPLPPRCGKELYIDTLEDALAQAGEGFQQLAISAGFDAHKDDPLASLGLEIQHFYDIGFVLGDLALPTFCVLEGGYIPEIMGPSIEMLIRGLEEAARSKEG